MRGGIYIHIPFCVSKCGYCDFYSIIPRGNILGDYTESLIHRIRNSTYKLSADTIYFGGGTPTLLGAGNLNKILTAINETFSPNNPEVTIEANPSTVTSKLLKDLFKMGFNRLSYGVQSMDEDELKLLGRVHGVKEVHSAFDLARNAGFKNISADVMLALPEQRESTLINSLEQIISLSPEHISAYILKIEQGTPFSKLYSPEDFPEDESAALYNLCCDTLSSAGYHRYEVSNFSKPNFESKHNMSYWQLTPYLGFGCSAHSYFDGKRFYTPSDIDAFVYEKDSDSLYIQDGEGGTFDEYVMLGLRLARGIDIDFLKKTFPSQTTKLIQKACPLIEKNMLIYSDNFLKIAPEHFLISNAIIFSLLD